MLAVLEINDAALTIRSESGELYSEPGFARITGTGIETGESARAAAWLEPQVTFNQYWQQLNETPLPVKTRWARHSADIAYAQLNRLLDTAGAVDRCALAVPGSLSNRQLGLLLGMLKAREIDTLAVVDSAVAAGLEAGRPTIYVDFQLHQAVVSVLEVDRGELSPGRQEVLPELGIIRLFNQLARAIADQMIETTRFDPLHDPATEQWLFDNLPHWLRQLQWQSELNLVMATPAGERPFRLDREAAAGLIQRRLESLARLRRAHAGLPLLLSHAGSPFAGLCPALEDADVAAPGAAVASCLAQVLPAVGVGEPLRRITALPVPDRADGVAGDRTPPLHLLHNHRAFCLSRPLSIAASGDDLTVREGVDGSALVCLVQQGAELEVLHRAADAVVNLPHRLRPGAEVEIAGIRLPLIQVDHG